MTDNDDFQSEYAAALQTYLAGRDEDSLAVGHELGRRALMEQISMLEIIERHFRLIDELAKHSEVDQPGSLEFLFQTLAPLDIATRGFIDGIRRYAEQRARAEDLADRDRSRTALVNSLQEGLFVTDRDGAVAEVNSAFVELLGYPAEGLPYHWPYPWLIDAKAALEDATRAVADGTAGYETLIRHHDGHLVWVKVSLNVVKEPGTDRDIYVGTLRDVTAERAFAARESAVLRLATSVAVAKSVDELLSITLEECQTAIDVQRVVAVIWTNGDQEPTVRVATAGDDAERSDEEQRRLGGVPAESTWRALDPWLRSTLEDARGQLPLTVKTIERPEDPGKTQGLVAALSGAGDIVLWLELGSPRWVSGEDRLLVTVLVGHLSMAMQHVRQFESARETSLTLQRAMLPPLRPPLGFAVRYEPAVTPLEIGGDWYDVLPIGDHLIGIVVGDCVGRGLPAAAIMGQLRSSARALLINGAQPALLLEQLDSAAALIPNAYCTTVFLAILDTESGLLEYSNAGHMPAVLAKGGPGSETAVLTDGTSVPLAVRRYQPRPQASMTLPKGSTLMLFTDGLVERKYQSIDDGIACAANILVQTADLPLEAVADAVLREMAPAEGYDDDIAMVIYRQHGTRLRIESDATADRLLSFRHRLGEWLRSARVPDALATDIVLVANEACTNCVEHAYRGQSVGTMLLEGNAANGEIRLRVSDSGSWKTPAAKPGNSGRGLLLVRALSDNLKVDGSATGTTVDITFRLL